jgi:Putative Ig domain
MQSKIFLAMVMGGLLLLSGCIEGLWKDTNRQAAGTVDDDDDENPPATNRAPTIFGTPTTVILTGEAYEFSPNASDADGDDLAFAITRKPAWANFDPTTGRLWGTPDSGDVGNYTNIAISVSDGSATDALMNFDITVDQIAIGSVELSWDPPVQNADGSTLTDLGGYKIYYGRDLNTLGRSVTLNNPGLTRYVVENLSPARWYFTMTSVNSDGVESSRSAVISKTIS